MDPRPTAARQRRVVRAGAASAVATLLAATAHTLSGGPAPEAWLVAAVTILAWPVAVALVGRRPSVPRTAAVVAAAQALLHTSFALTTGADPSRGGHVHSLDALGGVTAVAIPDTTMLGGHVLAAVVTTALLCRGERMLSALAAGVHELLRLAPPAPRVAPPMPRAASRAAVALRSRFLLVSLSHRGPPV